MVRSYFKKAAVAGKAHNSGSDSRTKVDDDDSGDWTDVTGVNCHITTTGNPVLVILTCSLSNSAAGYYSYARISREAAEAYSEQTVVGQGAGESNIMNTGAVVWLDTPPAGNHNYEPQIKTGAGGHVYVRNTTLVAVELRSHV